MHLLSDLLGRPAAAIDTPALVIDLDAMERNLDRMAAFAAQHGVMLRPHAKMHKSATLARLQMAHGAVGVCVQKTSEAEALAALGVNNIYISNEVVSPFKLKRVMAVARELQALGGQLAIAVDSLEGLRRLAQAAHGQHAAIRVFIEIDVGHGRCGLAPGAPAVALANEMALHPALQFGGLQAYHGRAQHLRTVAERQAAIAQVIAHVQATRAALQAAGHAVPLVTGAGTGTFALETASGVYGELQAGSYLFMDRDYADNERDPAQPPFEHALFVKSQVISSCASHAVVDAGHKSHAIDSGLPAVHGLALDYANGGDEHGILRGAVLPALGDTVWLIPGHCDPTVNLHDHLLGVRGGLEHGTVEQIIRVDARGALT
ncbi:MAG: DSD1 family PLP-dependent enzyme [Polaromonas sp.]|uniref:DSD1 family PLP-dependent enzyme n=1 Tax=Polaromonas sp. TaxID=1869339 RepID=UPI0027229697|nr:DSD1 family PLP-dependent enzyme [Polaromonas sp.]MDO9116047.1 DSD1 family PLP-dependent enzyme [Polaromonas sp.]MDP1884921.1 DSD1 family PLP-dependent enzyme [Polaromonas sp.]